MFIHILYVMPFLKSLQLEYCHISPKLHFRFPVEKDPQLYIICVDGVPRLNTCAAGSIFDKGSLGCVEQQTDFWLFRMQHIIINIDKQTWNWTWLADTELSSYFVSVCDTPVQVVFVFGMDWNNVS